MERYAPAGQGPGQPRRGERAPSYTEVHEGRGCGPNKDHVLLKLDHLGAEVIKKRLPGIRELGHALRRMPIRSTQPIPVFPTAHYTMGGIPTNRFGQVVAPVHTGPEEPVPGLYAVGECACVSVHGANRLGGNSLLDIMVFGRAAGNHIIEYLARTPSSPAGAGQTAADRALARLDALGPEGRRRIGGRVARRAAARDGGALRRVPHPGGAG